jgi:hypothetical protein
MENDVMPAQYKTYDMDSSPAKSLERSFITKDLAVIGKGLGAFAMNMLGGGLGLAAGTAISKGLPMPGDWLMTRSAKKQAAQAADERKYNPDKMQQCFRKTENQ